MDAALPIPAEPTALRALARALLEQAPDQGMPLVVAGGWLADVLWEPWHGPLERRGMDRETFGGVVAGFGNEVRLWVVGERPWAHCAAGLAGRVARRVPPAPSRLASVAAGDWEEALGRVGLSADAAEAELVDAVQRLRLLHDATTEDGGEERRSVHRAVVWAGARPADPEAPRGEGASPWSRAKALAQALGVFLLKDPAYPPGRHARLGLSV